MGIRTELSLRLPNSPGALAGVCGLLAGERVHVLAMSLDAGGQCRFIVNNPLRAIETLRANHHRVIERDVLVVEVSSGADGLAPILRLVSSAGVNVEYAYAASAESAASRLMVLGVDDAPRAATAAGI